MQDLPEGLAAALSTDEAETIAVGLVVAGMCKYRMQDKVSHRLT